MSAVVDEQIRSVLTAMQQVLGFASTVFARLDTERGGLVLSFILGDRSSFLRQASEMLGFDPTGAAFPLWADDSLFVRCYRQGRLLSTTDLRELWTGALSSDALEPIAEAVGERLLVCVPVPGTSGTILAVVMLDRRATTPLTAEERDHLLLYAARLGQLVEADQLGAPPVDSGFESPFSRWLSVHLLDRSQRPVWTAGSGPGASSVLAALGGELKPGQFEVTLDSGAAALVNVYMVDPYGQVSWLLLCENLARRDREVRELREQLRLRLARVHEAVVSVDAEQRVTGCNDATRDVLGVEPGEMIGRDLRSFLPQGKLRPTHRKLAKDLLAQGHVERQLRLRRHDGALFPAEISVMLLADEGEAPAGAIATVRDLSEQKRQAAERLRLRRKLLRSERLAALGEMAARIAHEVRNPLAAIGAAALSIEEDDEGGDTARTQAQAIGAEVRRLDAILTDLLQFARPRPVQRRRVDLAAVLPAAVNVAAADPLAAGVTIEIVVEPGQSFRVAGDADGVRQVLMNLLRNAIEACAPSGEVTCRLQRTEAGVRVEVEDTGSGLTRTSKRRAFEPFYSTKSRGTGLGLPISRRIIEEHGGTMTLHSRCGGGTTVAIDFGGGDDPN